jgi:hypothetical protein
MRARIWSNLTLYLDKVLESYRSHLHLEDSLYLLTTIKYRLVFDQHQCAYLTSLFGTIDRLWLQGIEVPERILANGRIPKMIDSFHLKMFTFNFGRNADTQERWDLATAFLPRTFLLLIPVLRGQKGCTISR